MMESEQKPVCCGCGGNTKIGKNEWHYDTGTIEEYYVYCEECLTATGAYDTEAKAIEAWNRAMSGATDTNVGDKERTAKAEWSEVDGCHLCGECGFAVCPNCDVYCAGCGARLEWE